MRDYYAILGVTPQAEDVVIKAAFRALAQRYHPDKYSGSADDAQRKMAEINEAYGVLSDPVKRKAYDAEYQSAGMGESDFDAGDAAADEGVQQFSQDWETAVEYYPDLTTLAATLATTSQSLAFTFRLYMITEKAFKNRRQVAELMHNAFLTRYFGEQKTVLAFAKTLITIGRKDAAKALNQAVRVLGDDIDSVLIIAKIKGRFGLSDSYRPSQSQPPPPPPPPKYVEPAIEEIAELAGSAGVPRGVARDMLFYGITTIEDRFYYDQYVYDRVEDAIRYAEIEFRRRPTD